MDSLGLSEEFRGVVLGEEEVIDGGCNFDTQPFGELLVLEREILDLLLLFDFCEEFGETVSFDDVSAESVLH